MDAINRSVQQSLGFLENPHVAAGLTTLLILYSGHAAPQLPPQVNTLFQNDLFRFVVIFLIAYTTSKNTTVSLLVSVVLLVVLTTGSQMAAPADEGYMGLDPRRMWGVPDAPVEELGYGEEEMFQEMAAAEEAMGAEESVAEEAMPEEVYPETIAEVAEEIVAEEAAGPVPVPPPGTVPGLDNMLHAPYHTPLNVHESDPAIPQYACNTVNIPNTNTLQGPYSARHSQLDSIEFMGYEPGSAYSDFN